MVNFFLYFFHSDEETSRPSFEEPWLHSGKKSSLPSLKDRSLTSGECFMKYFDCAFHENEKLLTGITSAYLSSNYALGPKDLGVSKGSAEFKELEEIDRRISELGFG
jgi:hypothetical protein